jgi:hypothetical protein
MCVIDNDGALGAAIYAGDNTRVQVIGSVIKGGTSAGIALSGSTLILYMTKVGNSTCTSISISTATASHRIALRILLLIIIISGSFV